jgi:hypothetical protein
MPGKEYINKDQEMAKKSCVIKQTQILDIFHCLIWLNMAFWKMALLPS